MDSDRQIVNKELSLSLYRAEKQRLANEPLSPTAYPESAALEATQGQMDDFFGQLPYKCHPEEVASVGD